MGYKLTAASKFNNVLNSTKTLCECHTEASPALRILTSCVCVCLLQERQSECVWSRGRWRRWTASTTSSPRRCGRCLRAPRRQSRSASCSRRPPSTRTASSRSVQQHPSVCVGVWVCVCDFLFECSWMSRKRDKWQEPKHTSKHTWAVEGEEEK